MLGALLDAAPGGSTARAVGRVVNRTVDSVANGLHALDALVDVRARLAGRERAFCPALSPPRQRCPSTAALTPHRRNAGLARRAGRAARRPPRAGHRRRLALRPLRRGGG